MKKSLKYSDYELQLTLLDTLNELGRIDNVRVKLECAKMLLYFIMVPTSKYWYMAVNRCAKLSAKNAEGHLIVYKQNTDALCEVIVHLCYCNQHIVNASLRESLCKVAVVLGKLNIVCSCKYPMVISILWKFMVCFLLLSFDGIAIS